MVPLKLSLSVTENAVYLLLHLVRQINQICLSFWGLWSVRPNPSCKNFMNYTVLLITIYRISCRWCKMELKSKPKQDWNSTYICAIWGLRIYKFFNPFSLPIWVTFQFELRSIFSDIPLWVKFQFEWHSNYYCCLFRNEYIPQGN